MPTSPIRSWYVPFSMMVLSVQAGDCGLALKDVIFAPEIWWPYTCVFTCPSLVIAST